MSDETDRQELQEYLRGLEEERRKVEAFKRELPLCMQLLTDAIQSTQAQLREDEGPMDSDDISEAQRPRDRSHPSHRPIPSSPRPPTADVSAHEPEAHPMFTPSFRGGPAWLSEAISARAAQQTSAETRALEQRMEGLGPALGERGPGRPLGDRGDEGGAPQPLFRTPGAFLPFSREQHSPHIARPRSPRAITYPLAVHLQNSMASHSAREYDESPASVLEERRAQAAAAGPSDGEAGHSNDGTSMATDKEGSTGALSRKQRRCWSPELHRRFVNALNQLGGSQVATPKQIRELMKVDGLTNDEVKSHLQKYRLHTRRPSPIPAPGGSPSPGQVVVLGSIWVPPEYNSGASSAAALYDAAAAAAVSSQGGPQAPAAAPLDEGRMPGGFHPASFFQVASGLLGPRHLPSNSSTDLNLSRGGEGGGGAEMQAALMPADVKEAQARVLPPGSFGGFRAFEPRGESSGGRDEDSRPLRMERRSAGVSAEASESVTEESLEAHHQGHKVEEDESSEGGVVQSLGKHAFRTFLPPRPEASAHKPG